MNKRWTYQKCVPFSERMGEKEEVYMCACVTRGWWSVVARAIFGLSVLSHLERQSRGNAYVIVWSVCDRIKDNKTERHTDRQTDTKTNIQTLIRHL